MLDILDFKSEEIEPDTCKGLTFRGKVSIFVTSNEQCIVQTKSVTLLKRKSCPGCAQCEWVLEYIKEQIAYGADTNLLDNIEHNRLYTYDVDISTDWETGHKEVDYISFSEIKQQEDSE